MEDIQALRTLQRIEKLLEQSLASARQEVSEERTAATRQAVKSRGKKGGADEVFEFTKQVVRATSRMSAFSDEADKLGKSTRAARADIISLRTGVRSTTSGLASMVQGIASSMSTLDFSKQEGALKQVDGLMGALSQSAQLASSSIDTLTGTSKRLNSAFEKVVGTVLRSNVVSSEISRVGAVLAEEAAEATVDSTRATVNNTRETTKAGNFFTGMLRRFGIQLQRTGDNSDAFDAQLTNLKVSFGDALIDLTRDIFYLQSRGIAGFSGSLIELYGNAMKAGMSLQEYTSLLQDNAAAVVRFGSFSEFGDSIDRTTRQLNRLGVFGPAAEQLAASLKTNAVSLGVPMAQQEGMIEGQVKVFEQLRKTTLMTADGFRELVADISNNESVQEQLLGLAPQERQARQMQIMQIATIGQRLGATAEASKSLTDALLAQRKSTVKDRFKAQGIVRQAGAITGMSSSRTEELARLSLQNPATLTPQQTERMTQLFAEFESRLQTLKNSGNLAAENISDELLALRSSVSAGQVSQAAARVNQQTQAGAAINAETGATTGPVMQQVGQALTALSGFMKNPLADAMVIFTGMLAQSVLQTGLAKWNVGWLKKIEANTGGRGDAADLLKGTKAGKGRGGILGRLGTFLAEAYTGAAGIDITDGPRREKGIGARIERDNAARKKNGFFSRMLGLDALDSIDLDLTDADMGTANAGTAIKRGIKDRILSVFKGLGKLGLVGVIFSSIEELFTGDLTESLNLGEGIGSRLLGMVAAGFNGFFSGFTRIIDDGLNWLSDGLGLGWNVNMTRLVDQATLYMTSAFKTIGTVFAEWGIGLKGSIAGILASTLEALPFVKEDAPWIKGLRATEKEATEGVAKQAEERKRINEEYQKTRDALWTGERTTLRSMATEQVKTQEETASKVKAITKTTQDNVVYGAENLLASARSTAAAMASPGATGATQIAMPQPTRQPTVTPPEVNRTQVEQTRRADNGPITGTMTVVGMTELIANAQQQLDVLKQMLALNNQRPESEEPSMRPTFSDAVTMNSSILAA